MIDDIGSALLKKSNLILKLFEEHCMFKHIPNSEIPVAFKNTKCMKTDCVHVGVNGMLVQKMPRGIYR